MNNLDSILKSRDITLPTKVHLVKAMVFPVVMYGCESSTLKKAWRQRIDAFGLWCWRRLLSILWTTRRSNKHILKEISPSNEHSGLIFFRMDWLDLFEVQGTLKSLLQHHSVRLYFLGLQNHCRCDCSYEIKRRLLLGRKVMTNLNRIFKSRDTTL